MLLRRDHSFHKGNNSKVIRNSYIVATRVLHSQKKSVQK